MALEISGTTAGQPNSSRFTLRGIPDSQVTNGEYAPTPAFRGFVADLLAYYLQGAPYGFVGRDLSNASFRVNLILDGVLTTGAVIPGVVNNQTFIRLHKVRDVNGNPVKGAFLVTAGAGTQNLTLAGFPAVSVGTSGTVRIDSLRFFPYSALQPGRILVRKIGRPFASYRGRASRRR